MKHKNLPIMKSVSHFTITIAMLLISYVFCTHTSAQQQLMLTPETIIISDKGDTISTNEFVEYMNKGGYTVGKQVVDDDGNLKSIHMVKLTDEERDKLSKSATTSTQKQEIKDAPVFNLTDMQGNVISTESTKGKVVVLNFWFTTCKPCVHEIPDLNMVYEKYKNNPDVVFAAVTFETEERINNFLEENPLKYPIVANDKETSKLFGVKGYPTNIVINKEGKIQGNLMGGSTGIGGRIEYYIKKALKGDNSASGTKSASRTKPKGYVDYDSDKYYLFAPDEASLIQGVEDLNRTNQRFKDLFGVQPAKHKLALFNDSQVLASYKSDLNTFKWVAESYAENSGMPSIMYKCGTMQHEISHTLLIKYFSTEIMKTSKTATCSCCPSGSKVGDSHKTIMKTSYGHPLLPDWIDEGVACHAETEFGIERRIKSFKELRETNYIPLKDLLTMKHPSAFGNTLSEEERNKLIEDAKETGTSMLMVTDTIRLDNQKGQKLKVDGEEITMYYSEALLLILYLKEKVGPDGLNKLLTHCSKEKDFKEFLKAEKKLPNSISKLEADFLKWTEKNI